MTTIQAHVATIEPDVTQDVPGLYEEAFPFVAAFVAKMGGSLEDAKDIFHDAFILYFEKQDSISVNVAPSAYILGIAKHLWLRKFKHERHRVNFDDVERNIEIPKEEYHPLTARLLRLIESAGKNCLDLLQAFYYEKLSAHEVASTLNYSDAHSASVQKHKCFQKIKNVVKEKSLQYESFFE